MKTAGMIVFSHYPADPRVRREAEALAESGVKVDVICLKARGTLSKERIGGVTVYRLPVRQKRGGKLRYAWEYGAFFALSFAKLALLSLKCRYDIVQIHNMPDFLVFAAEVARWRGARIVLDLHDPMPEVYVAKYALSASHPLVRFLILQERMSVRYADLVLTPNRAFAELFVRRGCPQEKISVVMNSPQESIFASSAAPADRRGAEGKSMWNIMYHGTIVERHGLDIALEALEKVRDAVPDIRFHVYGDGDYVPTFKSLIVQHGLQEEVVYHGQVSLETIASAIRETDLGIIPNKRNPFTEINLPTRILEYLSNGVSVIAPRTRGISDYFDEEAINFFEAGSAASLAATILAIRNDPERARSRLDRGIKVYQRHCWKSEKQNYLRVLDTKLEAGVKDATIGDQDH